ncbi:hypothetical protein Taro_005933 [Colocasia esculenta]|uniref:Anaphase-promoting complex subunit 4 WD40 domain-containing protein n=1 Tax=Colocasia esculenta TaxID=4460 RepID=A0A843TMC0_COLES|nr:hypothetical protein [Colocasia esculenta]
MKLAGLKSVENAHDDSIWACAWVPATDQRPALLLTGSLDETVRLWRPDALDRAWPSPSTGHCLGVVSVAAHPSGTLAASASLDSFVRVFDVDSNATVATLEAPPSEVWNMQFDPKKMWTSHISFLQAIAQVWDQVQDHPNAMVTLSNKLKVAKIALKKWNKEGSEGQRRRHWVAWHCILKPWKEGGLFIRDLQQVQLRDEDDLCVWTATAGGSFTIQSVSKILRSSGISRGPWANLWHSSLAPRAAIFFRKLIHRAVLVDSRVAECGIPMGNILAVAGGSSASVKLWDTSTWEVVATLTVPRPEQARPGDKSGSGKFVLSVAWSPDGRRLACGSMDGTIAVFDVARAKFLHHLDGHYMPVRSLVYSPVDARVLFSASDDTHVHMYDAEGKSLVGAMSGHTSWVLNVDASPDGAAIATGSSDRTVRLWDLGMRSAVQTMSNHTDLVWGVAFRPPGGTGVRAGRLASVSDDKSISLYDYS